MTPEEKLAKLRRLKELRDMKAQSVPAEQPSPEIMGAPEALGRGAFYGALQQPRDVIAAGVAAMSPNLTFKDALQSAREMSLEGRQGEAQQQRPGWFTGGQVAGNIAASILPAGAATKAVGAAAPVLSKAPVVGTGLSKLAQGVAASKGLAGVPLAGAIQGGVSTAMTEGDLSGALPGAVGAGVVGAIGKVARPIGEGAVSAARKGYVDVLKKAGIEDLTPGQLTGSPTLELVDSVLANMPFTAGPARKKAEGQLRKFTSAALQKAGQVGDDVGPEARQAIEQQFSQRYGDLINNEMVNIDQPVLDTIADIAAKRLDKLGPSKPVVESYMRDILGSRSRGPLSGAAYQEARSMLTQQARSMAQSDPFTANVLRDLRGALDKAAERSLPAAKKGAWSQLNKEYANYKAIQKAASTISDDALEGILPPSALNRAVENANKTKGQAGYGDLYGLGRAGRAVLADSIANSGTAQRNLVQQILTGGGFGLGAAGITGVTTGDPYAALGVGAAATFGGPRLAQALLNSRAGQQYFTQGIPVVNQLATKRAKDMAALLAAQAGE